MKHFRLFSLLGLLSLCLSLSAQVEADNNNYFYNPRKGDDHGKHKMKQLEQSIYLRDDFIWHAEAANVVYQKAGNASLLSSSRYGLTDRLELSTYLAEDVLRPNLYAKLLWRVWHNRWFFSSRFDVANAYSGFKLAQKLKVDRIISQDVEEYPLVFEMGHEFLLSRAWYQDKNCSDGSAYFILTFGFGTYGGINFTRDIKEIQQTRFHFLANRGKTVTDDAFRCKLKVWADGKINGRLFLHGGLMYHAGSYMKRHAVEIQAEGEFFFNARISAKAGLLTSFAHYQNIEKHAAIWPIVDFSYYFGRKKLRSSTLFEKGVYHGSVGI